MTDVSLGQAADDPEVTELDIRVFTDSEGSSIHNLVANLVSNTPPADA